MRPRPDHEDIDEVAVDGCAAGLIHHGKLTWAELELVVRRLEPHLNDSAIDRRIGAKQGMTATYRSRQGWPREAQPRGGWFCDSEARALLKRKPTGQPVQVAS